MVGDKVERVAELNKQLEARGRGMKPHGVVEDSMPCLLLHRQNKERIVLMEQAGSLQLRKEWVDLVVEAVANGGL